MTKKNAFIGFLLLGIGAYFLLRQLRVPLFVDFYSWPTLLIIIGAALLLHAYLAKDHK
ncbi:LiaI-LiaF-like domain-containing protein, partial [Terribacillus saccharophilus]